MSALGSSCSPFLALSLRFPHLDAQSHRDSLLRDSGAKSSKTGFEGLESGSQALREPGLAFHTSLPTPSSIGAMSEREERRFVEIPRESVRLMAESTGLELSDEVTALLAEDVCYRLREATQVPFPSPSPSL